MTILWRKPIGQSPTFQIRLKTITLPLVHQKREQEINAPLAENPDQSGFELSKYEAACVLALRSQYNFTLVMNKMTHSPFSITSNLTRRA
ncbi:hypothetical protein EDS67_16080 [candidate division KSB1 bacterium]|nr:MAG: hypothetical protein EDS67_16080 [candidate division KSB1 bacterium]MBC6949518.1 hypothetical protein [candidate division KSB1 bacterium]MCE7942619.1 hypothetical protein [Chlorobi bacterium CHB1]